MKSFQPLLKGLNRLQERGRRRQETMMYPVSRAVTECCVQQSKAGRSSACAGESASRMRSVSRRDADTPPAIVSTVLELARAWERLALRPGACRTSCARA